MYELALRRPTSTAVGAATVVALGVFSLLRLPVALLPEIERPQLVVTAHAAERSRDELLHGWTEPLERRLALVDGVTSLHSTTEEGVARIRLTSAWQTDADRLRIDVARRIEGAGEVAVDGVTVTSAESSPIVEVAVLGGESAAARTTLALEVVLPELARLPGAGHVDTLGAAHLRVVVRPHAAALAARGVSPAALAERLGWIGQPVSAGQVADGGRVRPLIVREEVRSLDELRARRVPSLAGNAGATAASASARAGVPLGELAEVTISEISDGTGYRWNGEPGVLVRLFRAPGGNAVALAGAARARIAAWRELPAGSPRVIVAEDRSRAVTAALAEIGIAALVGLLLGTLVLRAMLGRWGPTAALSLVIPASILASFAAFQLFGVPLDVVSLAGLALASGMLVDNSIVVLEAIETARAAGAADPPLAGTRQIAVAVTASTATTLVVFLPLLTLEGLARAFFGEQAFAVVASLAASLLFSLTLTPLLARRHAFSNPAGDTDRLGASISVDGEADDRGIAEASWRTPQARPREDNDASGRNPRDVPSRTWRTPPARPREDNDASGRNPRAVPKTGFSPGLSSYRTALDAALARPGRFLLLAAILATLSLASLLLLRRELFPAAEAHTSRIDWRLPSDSSAAEAARREKTIEDAARRAAAGTASGIRSLRGLPDEGEAAALADRFSATTSRRGRTELDFASSSMERDARKNIAAAVAALPDVEARVTPRPSPFAEVLRDSGELEIVVSALDEGRAEALAQRVSAELAERFGVRPIAADSENRSAFFVVWNEPRLAGLGLARAQAEADVRAALTPRDLGRADIPGVESAIRLEPVTPAELALVPIASARVGARVGADDSRLLPLGALARIEPGARGGKIERVDSQPSVRLIVPAGSGIDALALDRELSRLPVAAGERLRLSGAGLELARSFAQLRRALLLSLLLVFATIAVVYESLLLPAVVMSSVPVAAGGGFLFLAASGQSLNLMSFIGLILLGGIVVNHTIVLVDRIEQLRRAGHAEDEAIRMAGAERYRPILMTTLTTLLGMLPLALVGGEGVELRRALATTVVGGLVTSTVASLLVVPLLHRAAEGIRFRARRAEAGS